MWRSLRCALVTTLALVSVVSGFGGLAPTDHSRSTLSVASSAGSRAATGPRVSSRSGGPTLTLPGHEPTGTVPSLLPPNLAAPDSDSPPLVGHATSGKPSPASAGDPDGYQTLVLDNNTLVSGEFEPTEGREPVAVAYGQTTGQLYVADESSSSVFVIPTSTDRISSTIAVGGVAVAIASGYWNVSGTLVGAEFVALADNSEVSVISDATDQVVATVSVGSYPDAVAYDSDAGEIFVANYYSDNVSVLSATTDAVVATTSVGSHPLALAFDSGLGEMFVANFASNNTSVICDGAGVCGGSSMANHVVATVATSGGPSTEAYDRAIGDVLVGESSSNSTVLISGATNTIVDRTWWLNESPNGMVYDPVTGQFFVSLLANGTGEVGNVSVLATGPLQEVARVSVGAGPAGLAVVGGTGVFVANSWSGSLSVISDTTDEVSGNVDLLAYPTGIAYDPVSGQVFVANAASSGTVSVISGATDKSVATVSVGRDPDGVAYDAGTGDVWVANQGTSNISIISGTTDKIVGSTSSGTDPVALVYDSGVGQMWVANYGSDSVYYYQDSSVAYRVSLSGFPTALAYDSSQGEVFVSVWYYTYAYVYAICDGSAACGGASKTGAIVASVVLPESPPNWPDPVGMVYDPAKGEVFVAIENYYSPTQGGSICVISATTDTVVATVYVGDYGAEGDLAYDAAEGVVFVGGYGSVSEVSDATNAVVWTIPAGAVYHLALDTGNGRLFVSNYYPGTVGVIGPVYDVEFETNLPSGVTWYVNVTGPISSTQYTPNASIGFGEPNGSYSYKAGTWSQRYATYPGHFTVSGSSLVIDLGFRLVTYNETFESVGLPSGNQWSVTLNHSVRSTYSGAIWFLEPNDTYNYTLSPVPGFTISPTSGSVVVDGAGAVIAITFSRETYPASFYESGLVPGTPWSVDLNYTEAAVAGLNWTVPLGYYSSFYPVGEAYDSGTGQVFIADDVNGSVTVLNATDGYVVDTVAVGANPVNLTYDSGRNEVFVANAGSGNVSVISGTNDTVVASIPVGSYPSGIAYDPERGEVFVANADSSTVSVISDTSNTVVATIPVSEGSTSVTYDSGQHEVFVASKWSETVSVISDTNNTIVANLTLFGYEPIALAYDSDLSEVFVASYYPGAVIAISDTTDTVIGSVYVPTYADALVYDSGQQELFVSEYYESIVTAVSASSLALLANVVVGSGPDGLAYDPSLGEVFVSNSRDSTVSSVRDFPVVFTVSTTSRTTNLEFTLPNGSYPFAVPAPTGYVATPSGGNITVNGCAVGASIVFGLAPGYYLATFSESGLPLGTSWSVSVDGLPSWGSNTSDVSIVLANGSYTYTVTSANQTYSAFGGSFEVSGASPSVAVVFSELIVAPSARPNPAEVNETIQISAGASGGSGTYTTYTWSGLPAGCPSPGNVGSFTCTPTVAGDYRVGANVTDSNGGQVGVVFVLVVEPPLTATLSTSSSLTEVGQSTVLTLEFAGGVEPVAWTLTRNGSSANLSGVVAGRYMFEPAISGTYAFYLNSTDALGSVARASTVVSVRGALAARLIASSPSIDVGQSARLTIGTTGGVAPISWTFTVNGSSTNITGVAGGEYTFTPTAPGSYTFYLHASDALGGVSNPTLTVPVDPALAALPFVTATPIDAGQATVIGAGASGGTGSSTYTYAWSGLPTGCSNPGSVASFECSPSAAGAYSVQVVVTDKNGNELTGTVTLHVNPALVVPLPTVLNQTIRPGGSATLTGTAPDTGTAPYTYQWLEEAPGATQFSNAINCVAPTTLTCTFVTVGSTPTGTYHFELQVTDGASTPSIVTSTPVAVSVKTPASSAFPVWLWVALPAAVAVLVALALVLRARHHPRSPAGSSPAGNGTGTAASSDDGGKDASLGPPR